MTELNVLYRTDILEAGRVLPNSAIRVRRPTPAVLVRRETPHAWVSIGAETLIVPDDLLLTVGLPTIFTPAGGDDYTVSDWRSAECHLGPGMSPTVFRIARAHTDVNVILPFTASVELLDHTAFTSQATKDAVIPRGLWLHRLELHGYEKLLVELPYDIPLAGG